MVNGFKTGRRDIMGQHGVYFLAEIGLNHNGNLRLALDMVRSAAASGASGIKLQSYFTEEFLSPAYPSFDFFKSCELSVSDHREIANCCRDLGIDFISTPLCHSWVSVLDELDVAAIKIASSDINFYDLISVAAGTGRPLIISTGASGEDEIAALLAQNFMKNVKLVLLHCVSNYPPRLEDINLRCLPALRERFSVPIGMSDHSPGIAIAIGAVALGAVFIEKHFTISHELDGPDQKISMEPQEFRSMVCACDDVYRSLGQKEKKPVTGETDFLRIARRGLYLRHAVEKGELLSAENAVFLRPSNTVSCSDIRLEGQGWRFRHSCPAGAVSKEDLEEVS